MNTSPVWKPTKQEISPKEDAILNAVRASVFPMGEIGVKLANKGEWFTIPLKGENVLRVTVNMAEPIQSSFRERKAVSYRFMGYAALNVEGYKFSGMAIVDVITSAFLDCQISMESVGALTDLPKGRPH